MPHYNSPPPNSLVVYDRAPDGTLSPTPGSPFPIGGTPPAGPTGLYAAGFSPQGERVAASFLFTGGVQGATVAPDGTVTRAGGPTSTPSATGLVVSPDGRFVYVPTRTFGGTMAVGILGYAFGADGSLTPLPGSPYSTGEIGDIAMTPDGRFLFAWTGTGIARFAVGADGALTPLGELTLSATAITLDVSPNGRFLFAVTEPSGSDTLVSYSIDAAGGLTQNGDPLPIGDVSAGYISVAGDGRHIYIPEESSDVIVTAAVAEDGALSAVGSVPAENMVSVAASPDGRFLYTWDKIAIRVAPIGADGQPGAPLPASQPLDASTPSRMIFQPQPTPVAAFSAKSAAPKKSAKFDAGASERTARYDWDFGDGTVLADGGPTPTHKYAKAGKYDVTLTVVDEGGCSAAQVYTGQTTTCPGGPAATVTQKLDTLPALKKLKVKPRKVARGKRAKIVYKLTEKARVTLMLERKPRSRLAGSVKRKEQGKKGKNAVRLPTDGLAPGNYRITARAKDEARGKSKRVRTSFSIVD